MMHALHGRESVLAFVEDFNKEPPMATVNFSVPEDVKREFLAAFASENRSAVIARLMRQAVEERRRLQTRSAAIEQLLALRKGQEPAADDEVRRARQVGRP
jgi:hypothetical protein